MKQRSRRTAHHEAGHAVAAFLLGQELVSATVIPTATTLGEVAHRLPAGAPLSQAEHARAIVVIALAARAATTAYHTDASGFEPDDADAWRMARLIVGDDPALAPQVGQVVAEGWTAAVTLATDWHQAIGDVASNLQAFGTLEGPLLRQIVADAIAQDRASPYRQHLRDERRAMSAWLAEQKGVPTHDRNDHPATTDGDHPERGAGPGRAGGGPAGPAEPQAAGGDW